jgi:hypothetical protein
MVILNGKECTEHSYTDASLSGMQCLWVEAVACTLLLAYESVMFLHGHLLTLNIIFKSL